MPTKRHESADTWSTGDRLDPTLPCVAGTVLLGAVAALLDTTVVSVALDQLGEAFSVPVSTVQWVSTAYLLAMALVIPLTGCASTAPVPAGRGWRCWRCFWPALSCAA